MTAYDIIRDLLIVQLDEAQNDAERAEIQARIDGLNTQEKYDHFDEDEDGNIDPEF